VVGVEAEVVSDRQPADFFSPPLSRSGEDLGGDIVKRPHQPPRLRALNMGRSAGAEAVITAKLVSIADVTKPMLKVGSSDVARPKRPCTKMTRRTTDAIVTLCKRK
jgi:hypothetical protein